jgi:hypothetical protein
MTPKRFSGGCECGAIRYECSAENIVMFNCHCRACQQISGGPYVPVVLLPADSFKLTRGTLRHHFTPGAMMGKHKRGFCGDCGSRITGGQAEQPTSWIGVTASSLDDPSWFLPQYDIFASRAQPWDVMDPERPKYPQYPPES